MIYVSPKLTKILTSVLMVALLLIPVFTVRITRAEAQTNFTQQINYQGKLVNASSSAVANTGYAMTFRLYTVATSGAAIWTEARTATTSSGLFSVMLGSVSSLANVNFNQTLYLGVTVAGDSEMSPRKILGTVPSAFEAKNAQTVGGVASTSLLRDDDVGTIATSSTSTLLTVIQSGIGKILSLFSGAVEVFTVLNNGNVGIGTTTPGYKLGVSGTAFFGGDVTATGTISVTGSGTSTLGATTITTLNLSNALPITSGGTGATSALAARTNLGATTVGANMFTLANPGAQTLLRFNSDNTVAAVATSTLGVALADTTGTLTTLRGGTGLTSYATGDLIYASGANTLANRTIGSTGNILSVVGGVPSWVATSSLGFLSAAVTGIGPAGSIQTGPTITFATSTSAGPSGLTAGMLVTAAGNTITYQPTLAGTLNNAGLANSTISLATGSSGSDINWGAASVALGATATLNIPNSSAANRGLLTSADWTTFNGKVSSTSLDTIAKLDALITDVTGSTGTGSFVLSIAPTFTGTATFATTTIGSSTIGTLNLGTALAVGSGGTGATTLTGLLQGNGTGVFTAISNSSTVGQTLRVAGASTYAWGAIDIANSSAVTGTLAAANGGLGRSGFGGTGTILFTSATNTLATSSVFVFNGTNLGVGTAVPVQKLDVNGSIGISGVQALYIPGGNFTGTLVVGDGGSALTYATGTQGKYNTFLGLQSGASVTTGNSNTAAGFSALRSLTTGAGNTAFGNESLDAHATGFGNTAVGDQSMKVNTVGVFNTALGGSALRSLVGGNANVALGYSTLSSLTGGNDNIAIGEVSLNSNKNSDGNIALGAYAGLTVNSATSTGYNTIIGTSAGGGLTTGVNNTILGARVSGLSPALSNSIILADGAGTQRINVDSNGNVGMGSTTPSAKLTVIGGGYFGGDLVATGTLSIAGTATLSTTTIADLSVTRALRDSANSAGTLGMVLQSTATSTRWVATSTLGLGGATAFLGLSDTISSFTNGRVLYESASAVVDSANFTFLGNQLTVPTLGVTGTSSFANTFTLSGTAANIALGSNFLSGDGTDEGIYVAANGNVGIGTTTPASLLSLHGTGTANGLTFNNLATVNAIDSTTLGFNFGGINRWIVGAVGLYTDTGSGPGLAGVTDVVVRPRYADDTTGLSWGGTGVLGLRAGSSTRDTMTLNNGLIGIGTTTPGYSLSVVGSARITSTSTLADVILGGQLRDSANSAGTLGMVLQSTATSTRWVATSTLGFGNGRFTGLSDTISSYTNGRVLYESASAVVDSAGFTFLSNQLTVPTLGVTGTSSFANTLSLTGTAANIAMGINYISYDGSDTGLSVDVNNRFTLFNSEQFDPGDVSTGNALSLQTVGATSGINMFGSGLVFNKINSGRRGSAIVPVQTTADVDQMGLAFFTHGNSTTGDFLAERMRITAAGNVGIGTTTPIGTLTVSNSSAGITNLSTAADLFFIEGSGNTGLTIGSGPSSNGSIYFGDSAANNSGQIVYNHSVNEMQLWTAGSQAMVVTSANYVGINTATPQTVLDVGVTATNTRDAARSIVVKSGPANALTRYLGQIGFMSADPDIGTPKLVAYMAAEAEQTYASATTTAASLRFFTTASGNIAATERLTISKDGNVGIGTVTPNNLLHVYSSSAGVAASANANTVVVESATPAGISILTSSTTASSIYFGSDVSNGSGRIIYSHPTNYMAFWTAGAEQMRLDGSGHLGLGTPSPGSNMLRVMGSTRTFDITSIGGISLTSSTTNAAAALSITSADTLNSRNVAEFLSNSGATTGLVVTAAGNVGVGSSTPGYSLGVTGTSRVTGVALFDSTLGVTGLATFAAGVNVNGETVTDLTGAGLSNVAGALTVATSTLGLGNGRFTGLTDTISTYNNGRVLYESATAVIDSAGFTFLGNQLNTPTLSVSGTSSFTGAIAASSLTLTTPLGATSGGLGRSGFGGTNTILYSSAANVLATSSTFVFTGTNLGIGTSTPGYNLSVSGTARITGDTNIDGALTVGSAANELVPLGPGDILSGVATYGFQYDVSSGNWFSRSAANSTSGIHFNVQRGRGADTSAATALTTGDDIYLLRGWGMSATTSNIFTESSRITMDTEGTIGNGIVPGILRFHTASALGTLTERLTIDSDGVSTFIATSTSGNGPVAFRSFRAALVADSLLGGFNFLSADTNLGVEGSSSASIRAYASQTHTATALGSYLSFFTTPNGTVTPTESMRIDGVGSVAIGTTSANATLTVQGDINISDVGQGYEIGGSRVLYASSSTFSVSVGKNAGALLNDGAFLNTAVGDSALASATSSFGNTAIGGAALTYNTTGEQNTAVGLSALNVNTIGSYNAALGAASLNKNISGTGNVAVGYNSLFSNTTGSKNVAVGYGALGSNISGEFNTVIGHSAGQTLQTATSTGSNTMIGYGAGSGIITGVNNTILGAVSGLSATLSNNIIIGDGSGNQRINVGSTGNVGLGSTTPGYKLSVAGTARITGSTIFDSTVTMAGTASNLSIGSNWLSGDGGDEGITISSTGAVTIDVAGAVADVWIMGSSTGATGENRNLALYGNATNDDLILNYNSEYDCVSIGGITCANALDVTGDGSFSGSVGIGTTTPSDALSVAGNIKTYSGNIAVVGGTGFDAVALTNSSSNGRLIISNSVGSTSVFLASDVSSYFNGGSVGIGTTTPVATLAVLGNGGVNPFLVASSSGASLLNVLRNGNVGIGSTTPTSLLSVAGTFMVTSTSTTGSILPFGPFTNNISAFTLGSQTARWNQVWADTFNVGTSTWSIKTNTANRLGFFNSFNGAGTEALSIDNSGNMGVGTTAPAFRLSVVDSQATTYVARILNTNTTNTADGLLISLGVANASRGNGNYFIGFSDAAGTVAGKIQGGTTTAAVIYTTAAADLAEYFSVDRGRTMPQPGEIVTLDPNNDRGVMRAESGVTPFGIVATNPGFLGNGPICKARDNNCDSDYAKDNAIISLSGQVPVRVNLEGGPIKIGDNITLSSVTGVGKKATKTGETVVGVALADYTSVTSDALVMVYVVNKEHTSIADAARLKLFTVDLTSSSTVFASLLADATDTVWNRIAKLAQGFKDGVLTLTGLKTDSMEANTIKTEELCVGTTCISEDELKDIIEQKNAAGSSSGSSSGGNGGGGASDPVPTPTPDPVPTPEPASDPEPSGGGQQTPPADTGPGDAPALPESGV